MNYLKELNPPQHEAVIYTDGPMLIIAGPGSGKTRVLTYRIAYLMENGLDPFSILSLTFTNKAAKEMRDRISKIVGPQARNLFMGTFHSVFARILRVEAPRLGFPSNFTIYDTVDAKSVIKNIIKAQGLNDKVYKPNQVYFRISAAKNDLITAQDYAKNENLIAEDASSGKPKLSLIYTLYAKKCFENGAMDFDDLLINFYRMLKLFPDALYKYQNRFKHILVDEFQDTNTAQYEILKMLSDIHHQITVVGDDAQSIYAFRGATITNIYNFQKDFPSMHTVKLEQNYRSTGNIVKAANHLIKNNSNQFEKEIWTSQDSGKPIQIFKTVSDNEEGKRVADLIFELKMQEQLASDDFAILYRTNAQSRSMEEALRRRNIPYKIYGGLSFYQRKEIKDLIAYMRMLVNPKEEEGLRRIINFPKRGIGATTVAKITILASENNKSMWEIVETIKEHGFPARVTNAIDDFATLIKSFQTMLLTHNAYDVAFHMAKTTNILKEMYNDKTVEGVSRYENIQELLNGIKEFVEDDEVIEGEEFDNDKTLGTYLQNITLLTGGDNDNDDTPKVQLMTIHGAKGLEFPVVFIVGMEESLFPSAMSMYSREDLEEERRLFYVAVTRAEKYLYISFAKTRYKFGNLQFSEPSRFLKEIPKELIEFRNQQASVPENTTPKKEIVHKTGLNLQNKKPLVRKNPTTNYTAKVDPNFKASPMSDIKAGLSVEHQKFGQGVIREISGEGTPNKMAVIAFNSVGEKKLILKFAKLKIVELE
ncbi:MAG: DNA helicase-2/ATP-dependent DNA helicase PcrA [Planctomycetota bacterium]|jgi:DNA helicase-2/ATP-dependent DNA helicase PcrA